MPDLSSGSQPDIASVGFADAVRAEHVLHTLAGAGVPDDAIASLRPALISALRESSDPDRALTSFSRWLEAVTSRLTHVQLLTANRAALEAFCTVCGASQALANILIRNPEYLEVIANPALRGTVVSASVMERSISDFVDPVQRPSQKIEAVRRFKRREFLRIGSRDLLGLADLESTVLDYSNLADACVEKCLQALRIELDCPDEALSVIGMGKHGGQELNYASDIDLMFVCDDAVEGSPQREVAKVQKLAEALVSSLSKESENGRLFRVDVRLRPEGRFGPLVRSLSSFAAYYESWAEPWEIQALLKARPAAGYKDLGSRFMTLIEAHTYRRSVTSDFLEAIRTNKVRMEDRGRLRGALNVKHSPGGIRDIEFIVQLHQLRIGGRNPRARTPNTLCGLSRLRELGVIPRSTAAELASDYSFLRTVEHRLQLVNEEQTQTIPANPLERRLLARRMNMVDEHEFDAAFAQRTSRVRAHFELLFLKDGQRSDALDVEWSGLLATADSVETASTISRKLASLGFEDPDRVVSSLRIAGIGNDYGSSHPDAQQILVQLTPLLLASCSDTPDADAAWSGIESLVAASPDSAAFYRSLLEGAELRERLCSLAASSPPLIRSLQHNLEWIDMLVSDEVVGGSEKTAERYVEDASERRLIHNGLGASPLLAGDGFVRGLAGFVRRERLRIGAREIWGEASARSTLRDLTHLSETVCTCLLERVCQSLASDPNSCAAARRMCLVGMGKLGGAEMSYQSDCDVLLVINDRDSDDQVLLESLAERFLAYGQDLRSQDAPIVLDARLRPEGRFGRLVRSVNEYADYYRESALTWELQALTKARPIAGSPDTGRTFMRAIHKVIYSEPLGAERRAQIQEMKRRIESERLRPEEAYTDLKLGHGGMSDIEFLAQTLQLEHGFSKPTVRCQGTVSALAELSRAGALESSDAQLLIRAYHLWGAVRNRLALAGAERPELVPAGAPGLRHIVPVVSGDGSGSADPVGTVQKLMRSVRTVVERVFYA